jgi:hypothetical protein
MYHADGGLMMFKIAGFAAAAALVMAPALAPPPATSSTAALAPAQGAPADEEHHGPRPESIAACKDKGEGDACEFDAPRGHVTGTCRKVRSGDIACVHPHPHHDAGTS